MNKNKNGNKPLVFPNSFILVIGYIRYFFHLPYRQTEGIIKTTGKSLPVNTEPIPKFDKIIALFPLLITVTCIRRMDSVNKNNKHPTILKVPDELWDKIKNIFPKEKPLKTVGRPIIPYRKVIDGILYVLRT